MAGRGTNKHMGRAPGGRGGGWDAAPVFLFRLGVLQLSSSPACSGEARERPALPGMGMGEGGDCDRADGAGQEQSGSACGENTQPQPWGYRGIGGFNPAQCKSGCGMVAMKARNTVSLSSRVEITILQCSDLHLHLAAVGPSPRKGDLPQPSGAVQTEQLCLLQSWARRRAAGWPQRWGPLLCGQETRSIWAHKSQGKDPGWC